MKLKPVLTLFNHVRLSILISAMTIFACSAFSASSKAAEIKSTKEAMEACSDLLYPKVLPFDQVRSEILQALQTYPELVGIKMGVKPMLPLSFLHIVRDLIRAGDIDLRAILNAALNDDFQTNNDRFYRDLEFFLTMYVYDASHISLLNEDLDDTNLQIFKAGFASSIKRVGAIIKDYPRLQHISLINEADKAVQDDVLQWFRERRDLLDEVVSKVNSGEWPVPNQETRWAKRVATLVKRAFRKWNDSAGNELSPDEIRLLEELPLLHNQDIPRYVDRVRPAEPPMSNLGRLRQVLRNLFVAKPEEVVLPPRLVPDVNLPPDDPRWLFNQVIPGSRDNYVGDQTERGFVNFQSLANRGEMPDIGRDPRWWKSSAKTGQADVTGLTSRGLPRDFRGENFRRTFLWPYGMWTPIQLDSMRVALTQSPDDKPLTLEVLASKDGLQWEAFYFHREGALWVMDSEVAGIPVKQKCLQCHTSDGAGKVPMGLLSPRPSFMKVEQDFLDVGYKDIELIRRFLEY